MNGGGFPTLNRQFNFCGAKVIQIGEHLIKWREVDFDLVLKHTIIVLEE